MPSSAGPPPEHPPVSSDSGDQTLAATLNSIPDLVFAADSKGTIMYMNQAAEEVTGWFLGDAVGQPLSQVARLVREGDRAAVRLPTVEELERFELPVDTVLVRPQGALLPVSGGLSSVRDPGGQTEGFVLRLQDVTDHRRAEKARRKAELELELAQRDLLGLVEAVPVGIVLLRAGRVVYVNPCFASTVGLSADGLAGLSMVELVEEEGRETAATWTEEASANASPVELPFKRFTGEKVILEVTRGGALSLRGNRTTMLVTLDVTERKRLQERLMLADRMVSVGTLAAGVAHEINNPLSFIISNVHFLRAELEKLAEAHPGETERLREAMSALADATTGAERVRDVVRDLKTFSRGDGSVTEAVDLREVLKICINMAKNEIHHRAMLVTEFSEAPFAAGNRSRLGQVFLNLLMNAAQAIPEGDAAQNRIFLRLRRGPGGEAVVEVSDTGKGIPQQLLGRIFDPFFTTKSVGEGTGLGLSVCKNIVNEHKGRIEVETRVGQGSTFRVILPSSDGDAVLSPKAAEATAPGPRRCRLLIIDDEPLILATLKRVLKHDHDVVVCASAHEAITRLGVDRGFDLLLCDLMMPDQTGMDFHAELAVIAPELMGKLVFMTGGAFTERAKEFLDRRTIPPLEKPFEISEIRDTVRKLLERLGARGGVADTLGVGGPSDPGPEDPGNRGS
jgi:PAS domain S-box-containing protein